MDKFEYKISGPDANRLIASIAESLFKAVDKKHATIEEQGFCLSDIASAMKNPDFNQPTSKMAIEEIFMLSQKANKRIEKATTRLARKVFKDPSEEQEMARSEYFAQLQTALFVRLAIIRAQDGIEKWEKAGKYATGIAVGTLAASAVAALVAKHLRRNEDAETAHERAQIQEAGARIKQERT